MAAVLSPGSRPNLMTTGVFWNSISRAMTVKPQNSKVWFWILVPRWGNFAKRLMALRGIGNTVKIRSSFKVLVELKEKDRPWPSFLETEGYNLGIFNMIYAGVTNRRNFSLQAVRHLRYIKSARPTFLVFGFLLLWISSSLRVTYQI